MSVQLSGPGMIPRFKLRQAVRSVRKKPIIKTVATKKYVKKQISKNAEVKYFDTTYSNTVDYNGSIAELTNISQGDTDVTRDGDKVVMKNLYFHANVVAADATNICRIIIIQWYPNSTLLAPTVATVLTSTGSALSVLGPYVHDYENQFKVLYDKTFEVDTYNPQRIATRRAINLRYAKKQINFTAATTGASNKLYVIFMSDSAAVNHPSFQAYSRLHFTDM